MRMPPPKISPRIHVIMCHADTMDFKDFPRMAIQAITGKNPSELNGFASVSKIALEAKNKGIILDDRFESQDFGRTNAAIIVKAAPIGKKLRESMERLGQKAAPSAESVARAIHAGITRIRRAMS